MMPDEVWISGNSTEKYVTDKEDDRWGRESYLKRIATKEEAKAVLDDFTETLMHRGNLGLSRDTHNTIIRLLRQSAGEV